MSLFDIKKLQEQRNAKLTEARSFLDQVTDESTAEEAREIEAKYDAAMADYDQLGERLERAQRLADAESRSDQSDGSRIPGAEDRGTAGDGDDQADAMTVDEAFTLAMRFGPEAMTAEVRNLLSRDTEALRDLPPEIRAQAVGTDSAGGYTVPEGFQAEIIKTMAMWGPMLDPSVTRVLVTATGNQIPWPTVDDTSNVGALLAENTQEGEEDVVFAEKVLNAYKYSSDIIRVSLELLQDSAFNMDSLIAELFGERLGRISNTALTTGTGSSQPNGIVTASSAGKTAASATAITMDELIDLLHSVDPAYRQGPGVRWMFNDSTLASIRKLKGGDGNYLWQPANAVTGEPAQLLDHPYVVNQAMASIATGNKTVLFGAFNKYVVRRVRDFNMLRLSERYADYYQVGFLAFNRIDGELLDTAAVKHLIQA